MFAKTLQCRNGEGITEQEAFQLDLERQGGSLKAKMVGEDILSKNKIRAGIY